MNTEMVRQVDELARNADASFGVYRHTHATRKSAFLRELGKAINDNKEHLVKVAAEETNLARERLLAEVTRTVNQCILFADLLADGSWVRAIIDTALPDRKPVPRPDLRQMQIPLGPVAVFGASNFPFAYSVAGGDTIAALAAGCPVIYKVNPGHPQTSDVVAGIVQSAAHQQQLPAHIFQHIHGEGNETGTALVTHPLIKAVGFTGSWQGGRALFDAAAKRPEPIPVYAEMGSTNPVFVLPGILAEKREELARILHESNTSGAGQFCTYPGIMITPATRQAEEFREDFARRVKTTPAARMLNTGILNNFNKTISRVKEKKSVSELASSRTEVTGETGAYAFSVTSSDFLHDHELWEEMFGPASLQVTAASKADLLEIAKALPGQITASVWGTEDDLEEHKELIGYLELKAGRIIINGVPTGVEVSPAMNHGGPYPATTDSKFTSVGTQSIYRFTRPVCYQNYPQQLLPEELKDENSRNIWRLINGAFSK